jgi:hypothetical protein
MRSLRAPAAATAASTSRAVTPAPARSTSRTTSASRPGRYNDGATLLAGRTSRPTNPRSSGTDLRPGPAARGSPPRSRSTTPRWRSTASWSGTPTRAESRASRPRPSKAAWWQATARRWPPDPTTTRRGGWVARSKRLTRAGASRGSPSTIRGSGGEPGCQTSPWRRAPVIGTERWRAARRSSSRSTGAAMVAAITTAQVVRRSGNRSRARALAEAGAGSPGPPPIAGPRGRGRSGSTPRPGGRGRPGGGTRAGGGSARRTRGGGGCRRTGGSG